MMNLRLIEIAIDGRPSEDVILPEMAISACEATQSLYKREGFVRPWTCYLAVQGGEVVGMCGFKSPPIDGTVEIAYGTVPGHEGKGIATELARQLIELARTADSSIHVVAQTLPEENASTTILRKLGFILTGTVQHPEDGEVWEWKLGEYIDRPE